ncbi:MAG: LPP20 family lipoprotein [Verrucomicrobia bacterium]|nr:LPP20 family lipoprotein [Verrucomicrobiota bacterium]
MNPKSAYPEAQYLTAIGEGDSRRAAENNAAAGLSRIFESRIHAVETLSETTTETRGAVERFDQFSELRANIQIGSEQELLNIQFGEAFTDRRGRVHAAAFIPRAETAAIYRKRISEGSSAIILLTRLSDTAVSPVEKYAFRRAAVRKALENDRSIAQLDIIDPSARDFLSLTYDPQTLYTETAAAAHNVTFSVEGVDEAMRGALAEVLTGMGFSEKNEYPAFNFSGTAEFEDADLKRGPLKFVRYRFALEMRTRDGKLVLALSGSHREGHISFEEATARAGRSLHAELRALIPKELGGYLDRLASAE